MQSSTRSIMPAMQVSCIDVACTLGAWQVLSENRRVSAVQEATYDGKARRSCCRPWGGAHASSCPPSVARTLFPKEQKSIRSLAMSKTCQELPCPLPPSRVVDVA